MSKGEEKKWKRRQQKKAEEVAYVNRMFIKEQRIEQPGPPTKNVVFEQSGDFTVSYPVNLILCTCSQCTCNPWAVFIFLLQAEHR